MTRKQSQRSRWVFAALTLMGSTAYVWGCGSNAPPPPPPGGAPAPPRPSVVTKASGSASGSSSTLPVMAFVDGDFTESDSSRDPFRNFNRVYAPASASVVLAPQYTVELKEYTVDQLKLIAIVMAGDGGRAMFVDPKGKGWVLHRGQYIGVGDVLRAPGSQGPGAPVHWKIDRIKPDMVILVKQDTMHPEIPPTYREVPLHTEGEKT